MCLLLQRNNVKDEAVSDVWLYLIFFSLCAVSFQKSASGDEAVKTDFYSVFDIFFSSSPIHSIMLDNVSTLHAVCAELQNIFLYLIFFFFFDPERYKQS